MVQEVLKSLICEEKHVIFLCLLLKSSSIHKQELVLMLAMQSQPSGVVEE